MNKDYKHVIALSEEDYDILTQIVDDYGCFSEVINSLKKEYNDTMAHCHNQCPQLNYTKLKIFEEEKIWNLYGNLDGVYFSKEQYNDLMIKLTKLKETSNDAGVETLLNELKAVVKN